MSDNGEVAEREKLPVPLRGSFVVQRASFVTPLFGHHVLEGVLAEAEKRGTAHAWPDAAFQ